jgi:hypothetical protein
MEPKERDYNEDEELGEEVKDELTAETTTTNIVF